MSSEKFYNNYLHNSYNQTLLNQNESAQYKDYLVKNFKEFFPEDKSGSILDIGVGNGRTLSALKELGYTNCLGIDIAEDLVKEAIKKGLKCQYIEDTNAFLDSNKRKYAFIFLSHVIEHIPKQEAVVFLEKVRQSLEKNGTLVIVTPSVQNIFYVGPFWDFTHLNFFTERSLYQLCEASGFKNIKLLPEVMPINVYGKGVKNYLRFLMSDMVIRCIQLLVYSMLRMVRSGIGTINPKILSPNLVSICKNHE